MTKNKKLILCLIMCAPLLINAQKKNTGIKFDGGLTWEEVKTKAKAENKYIFVDCYATWCVPCKKMDKEIYPSDTVGNFINEKFISVKVQMDTSKQDNAEIQNWYADAHIINKEYRITAFPSFLFFSPDGRIVHKDVGFKKIDDFIRTAGDASNPSKQYYTLLENYQHGKKDYKTMGYLALSAKMLSEANLADTIATDYKINFLDKLNQEELSNRKYLNLINSFSLQYIYKEGSKGRFFNLLYHNEGKIDSIMNWKGWAYHYVKNIITIEEINDKLYRGDKPINKKPDWNKIKSEIRRKYDVDADRLVIDAQIIYYGIIKNWPDQMKYFVKKVDKYGLFVLGFNQDGYGADNDIVDIILMHTDNPKLLNKAIKWMEILIAKTDPSQQWALYGNYGGLLYKAGRTVEGISWVEKQVKLIVDGYAAEGKPPPGDYYQQKLQLLAKMKRGDKINETWDVTSFY